MKVTKGEAGYIRRKKTTELVKVILEFGIVIALFVTGYVTTKTRLNLLTLVAVLGCLPASKALVGYLMLFPRKSLEEEKVMEIQQTGPHLTKAYDMIITSYEHVMPIDSIVIEGNSVCGYTKNEKIDLGYAESYIKKALLQQHCEKVTVKIFREYPAFLSRVQALEVLAGNGKEQDKTREEGMKHTILTLSM